jgi:opacity protein-like surface antigen
MRWLAFLLAMPAAAQSMSVSAKGGIPITEFETTESYRYGSLSASTNRYLIGPAVEVRLPGRFAIEFDALYQRLHVRGTTRAVAIYPDYSTRADGHAWQLPVLAKYRLLPGPVSPFIAGGPAFRRSTLSGTVMVTNVNQAGAPVSTSRALDEKQFETGWTVGGGVELRLGPLRIAPEFRYSRFGDFNCSSCGFSSNIPALDSTSVMLGVGF